MPSASRLLVTGAGGFIGRRLVEVLARDGRPVRAVTRSPGLVPAGAEALDLGAFSGDTRWEGAVDQVDAVLHCAARAHVLDEDAGDPLAAFRKVNRDATLQLAETAAAAGVRRFIFLSSIGVLGERTRPGRPFTGGDLPAPAAPYAHSKLEAEQGLLAIGARTGMEVVIVRPPLVHGPRAPGNFGRLLRLVDRGLPLPLGGIANRRTFVGRENLVDLLVLAVTHRRAPGVPLLPADDRAVSTTELLRLIGSGMGRRVLLVPIPGLALFRGFGGPGRAIGKLIDSLEVDGTETMERLGWRPRTTVVEGVAEMARAWKERPW